MRRLFTFFEAHAWLAPAIMLGAFLVIGVAASRDYGIAWDEPVQRQYGSEVYSYVVHGDQSLFLNRHRYYGPVFEMLFFSLEKAFGLGDTRSIYLMRHLVNFLLLWAGACFFYLLARYVFKSWKMGLLASAMLLVSPRIFAHGFYNTKDIPFLSVFIIGVYTLARYLDAKTLPRAILHGLVCAVLVDTRIVGIFLVALTLAFTAYDVLRGRALRDGGRKTALGLAAFVVSWAGATVLLWPTLWRDPLANFVRVFEGMRNFPWEATVLYLGRYVWSTALPWHYTPVWIAISTPIVYVAMFCVGLAVSLGLLARHERVMGLVNSAGSPHLPKPRRPVAPPAPPTSPASGRIPCKRDLFLVLAWFFLPLFYSIASRAVLYDEWRHSFFIYPAFLVVGLVGLRGLWRFVNRRCGRRSRKALATALVLVIAVNMIEVTAFMIRHHPFENVYFNILAGGPRGAHGRFEMDYWGLSHRQGLEFILRSDPNQRISVHAATAAGRYNAEILKAADRQRIVFVSELSDAKYHITNFRWDRERFAPEAEAYAVRIDGAPIMAVYRR
jgi:hypothetical protein